jgi:NADH dehydrogenase
MSPLPQRILVTGANGNLGKQLIGRLCDVSDEDGGERPIVRALVRSEAAASRVRNISTACRPEVMVGDYTDAKSMGQAVAGCSGVVHLVGIIKESERATYTAAHEETCRVLEEVSAQAGCRRIVYLSIFGSKPGAANSCLNSKGLAEQILLEGRVPTTILRVPMVLGPDDFSSAALRAQAQSRIVPLVGGGRTLQQPIDSRDVVNAILAALADESGAMTAFDLGGPECLEHRELLGQVAAFHGKKPRVLSIPAPLARLFAGAMERLSSNPPITRAMLEILQSDDRIDQAPCCQRLGIALTPLNETLRAYMGPEVPPEVLGERLSSNPSQKSKTEAEADTHD